MTIYLLWLNSQSLKCKENKSEQNPTLTLSTHEVYILFLFAFSLTDKMDDKKTEPYQFVTLLLERKCKRIVVASWWWFIAFWSIWWPMTVWCMKNGGNDWESYEKWSVKIQSKNCGVIRTNEWQTDNCICEIPFNYIITTSRPIDSTIHWQFNLNSTINTFRMDSHSCFRAAFKLMSCSIGIEKLTNTVTMDWVERFYKAQVAKSGDTHTPLHSIWRRSNHKQWEM